MNPGDVLGFTAGALMPACAIIPKPSLLAHGARYVAARVRSAVTNRQNLRRAKLVIEALLGPLMFLA